MSNSQLLQQCIRHGYTQSTNNPGVVFFQADDCVKDPKCTVKLSNLSRPICAPKHSPSWRTLSPSGSPASVSSLEGTPSTPLSSLSSYHSVPGSHAPQSSTLHKKQSQESPSSRSQSATSEPLHVSHQTPSRSGAEHATVLLHENASVHPTSFQQDLQLKRDASGHPHAVVWGQPGITPGQNAYLVSEHSLHDAAQKAVPSPKKIPLANLPDHMGMHSLVQLKKNVLDAVRTAQYGPLDETISEQIDALRMEIVKDAAALLRDTKKEYRASVKQQIEKDFRKFNSFIFQMLVPSKYIFTNNTTQSDRIIEQSAPICIDNNAHEKSLKERLKQIELLMITNEDEAPIEKRFRGLWSTVSEVQEILHDMHSNPLGTIEVSEKIMQIQPGIHSESQERHTAAITRIASGTDDLFFSTLYQICPPPRIRNKEPLSSDALLEIPMSETLPATSYLLRRVLLSLMASPVHTRQQTIPAINFLRAFQAIRVVSEMFEQNEHDFVCFLSKPKTIGMQHVFNMLHMLADHQYVSIHTTSHQPQALCEKDLESFFTHPYDYAPEYDRPLLQSYPKAKILPYHSFWEEQLPAESEDMVKHSKDSLPEKLLKTLEKFKNEYAETIKSSNLSSEEQTYLKLKYNDGAVATLMDWAASFQILAGMGLVSSPSQFAPLKGEMETYLNESKYIMLSSLDPKLNRTTLPKFSQNIIHKAANIQQYVFLPIKNSFRNTLRGIVRQQPAEEKIEIITPLGQSNLHEIFQDFHPLISQFFEKHVDLPRALAQLCKTGQLQKLYDNIKNFRSGRNKKQCIGYVLRRLIISLLEIKVNEQVNEASIESMTNNFVAFKIIADAIITSNRYVILLLPPQYCSHALAILRALTQVHYAQEMACKTQTQQMINNCRTAQSPHLADATDFLTPLCNDRT